MRWLSLASISLAIVFMHTVIFFIRPDYRFQWSVMLIWLTNIVIGLLVISIRIFLEIAVRLYVLTKYRERKSYDLIRVIMAKYVYPLIYTLLIFWSIFIIGYTVEQMF